MTWRATSSWAIRSKTRNSTRAIASRRSTASSPIPCGIRIGGRKPTTTPTSLTAFPKVRATPGDWGWVQIILASLKPQGRAAVVLDTGAASRGSGNANTNKEKEVRRWFIEHDLIEGVIYLPENLFYNTTAPGIILVLNKAKPKARQGKLFLLNATNEFTKGDPKNYLADDAIMRIADTFSAWKEVEKYSRIVAREEIAKNDFNISPSRYIHIAEGEEYRPIREIMEDLAELEAEASETNASLRQVLELLIR